MGEQASLVDRREEQQYEAADLLDAWRGSTLRGELPPSSRTCRYWPMYLLMALILAGPMTPPGTPTLLALAAIAVCVGFGEELMFRGLVFHWFRDRTVRAQILISSLAFGGAHLIALLHVDAPAVILSQAFFASAVGAVFASARARDRSIWIPIMVHSLFDFVALAASGSIGEALADTPETVVRLLVGGAVIWLWGATWCGGRHAGSRHIWR